MLRVDCRLVPGRINRGQKRYATEVVAQTVQFLGAGGANPNAGAGQSAGGSDANFPQDFGNEPAFDASENIPF